MTQQGYEILKSFSMNPSSMSALVEEEEEGVSYTLCHCLKVGGQWVMKGWAGGLKS